MHNMRVLGSAILLSNLAWALPQAETAASQLPTVDLGYEIHQALSLNKTGNYYQFSNIRYAQPPVGNLRWRAPLPPKTNRTTIQRGAQARTCPQGYPTWFRKDLEPIGEYSNGKPFTIESWESDIASSPPLQFDPNQGASEDCLFLDVYVPRKVLEGIKANSSTFQKVPVVTWIHGGGYIFGSKTGTPTPTYDPSGLMTLSQQLSDSGMIFVAMNYRLGALGFLSGPEVQEDGNENAALLDQRLALQWVQKYIGLFGGDAAKVTAMGESGGAYSVLAQMSANGGEKAPFSQAILQSAAGQPNLDNPPSKFSDFLAALNVTSLSEARNLPSSKIIAGNAAQIAGSKAADFGWNAATDPSFFSSSPTEILKNGAVDKSVKVLASANAFEGSFFFDYTVKTEADIRQWLSRSLVNLSKKDSTYILKTLYPPVFDGSYGYRDQNQRQIAIWGDGGINCNTYAVANTFADSIHGYKFSVSPGLHIQDLSYSFNDPTGGAYVPAAQDVLQAALVSFILTGTPIVKINGQTKPFPKYGKGHNVVNITETTANVIKPGWGFNETRCDWWSNKRFAA